MSYEYRANHDERPSANVTSVGWHPIDGESKQWAQDASLPPLSPQQLRLTIPGRCRLAHAQVFRALWSRGFFITCGSNFGADYLCYPGDPMRHHAHLLVHVARPGQPQNAIELAAAARLANSVKKAAVLAEQDLGRAFRYTQGRFEHLLLCSRAFH